MSIESSAKGGIFPPAKAVRAAELLQVQEGAVVSRTLLKHTNGSVTLFAFDEGQGLSEHTSPFDAFVFLLEGAAEIRISGNPISLSQGDLVLLPANQPHGVKAVTPFKMILTMLRS